MSTSTHLHPNDIVEVAGTTPRDPHSNAQLHFPFRANAIARKARSPGQSELNYQFTDGLRERQASESGEGILGAVPMPRGFDPSRRSSEESDGGLSVGGNTRRMMYDQIHREEDIGDAEEEDEMERAADQDSISSGLHLATPISEDLPNEENTAAALREAPDDELLEDGMQENRTERMRVRREKLSERLMEVFGLEEKEEVLEEMRCWLLRSVSE